MKELTLNVTQNPGVIELNFEEMEQALDAKLKQYEGAIFTEESRVLAKQEVAYLRKLKEKFETARKSVKKEWMKPYDDFEQKIKRLTVKIDEPITLIDAQVKEFERKRKEERREAIKEIYHELIGDMEEYCELGRIYDPKWENATTTIKSIKDSISASIDSARTAVQTISGMQSDAVEKALSIYKDSMDMAKAISYINNYEQQKAEIIRREEERRRRKEERKRQEEEARIRAQERAAIEREKAIREQVEREAEQARMEEMLQAPFGDEMSDKAGDEVLPFTQPDTRIVFYRVVATEEDIQAIDMSLDSIGVYYERRNG